ncbi:FAD-dependent oxidoreductase [Pasteurella atlantica]|uniref:FAD-dependent oxidoreductase n=1 Tax=Pasteurellaceae TaxID=712 RepID=UPI002762442C|nr:FAD-dependent oxidoreductase [Pasteurella atlantica]MDP8098665.1 FAD-dependent oxidoreductase [Pasteurella atlantica]MDP8106777.1 FAD-dependent oxidoreductase [Pasteurella atlantica]MDP8116467.1 FAD-dependent oxidoreductase [Pasteurella atlantica]
MKNKRYLVVGGVAGGASAAARIRRLDPYADVIVFERNRDASFSNCCLPYHLSETVYPAEKLIVLSKEDLTNQYNLDVRTSTEVTAIDRKNKSVTVKNLLTGEIYTESYDKLVLSPGATAVRPQSIIGVNNDNVFVVRNNVDIEKLKGFIDSKKIKDIAVIGGGFVGIECAESLIENGHNVSLVEAQEQILLPFDYDMVQILHKEMIDNKVNLVLNDSLKEITDNEIILASGKRINAQAVILSIGIACETTLAKNGGLDIGKTGGILVNQHYLTSDPHIYAIGDAIEVTHQITRQKTKLAMAGPAQRQARAVADHIMGRTVKNNGVIGSGCVRVFKMNAARTGLSERECIEAGIEYDFAFIIPKDKVGLMPNANAIPLKLIFEVPTGQILGAQSIGEGNVDKRIDIIAAMITMKANLDDLKELELCYAPVFSTAKDVTNMASLVGLNLLNGDYQQVRLPEIRRIVENKEALIIDCREENEYNAGHIIGAINIPLSQFRNRLDEIPKDRPVICHCLSSQRSYIMVRELINRGYSNVKNMVGSFMGLSLYEYFNDVDQQRTPIITKYKFNFKD